MVYQKSPVLVCTILREGYKLAKGYPIFPDTLVPVKAQYFFAEVAFSYKNTKSKFIKLRFSNYDLKIKNKERFIGINKTISIN